MFCSHRYDVVYVKSLALVVVIVSSWYVFCVLILCSGMFCLLISHIGSLHSVSIVLVLLVSVLTLGAVVLSIHNAADALP